MKKSISTDDNKNILSIVFYEYLTISHFKNYDTNDIIYSF